MRKLFFKKLFEVMEDENVWFLTGDLGYGGIDPIQTCYPERFVNCGASEQAMMGMAVGLSLEGKTVFTYTISPFYLRAYETIKLYIDREKSPVIMVGSGLNDDYAENGFSHEAWDIPGIMHNFKSIRYVQPLDEDDMNLKAIIKERQPYYIGLKR
jgi:transketolase